MNVETVNVLLQNSCRDAGCKKTYSKPTLVIYGSVRSFTLAGLSGPPEDGNQGASKKPGSDRALKENISKIGEHPLGMGLYLFDYRPEHRSTHGDGRRFGVMADEVELFVPAAVSMHADGYKRVDYEMLGIDISVQQFH